MHPHVQNSCNASGIYLKHNLKILLNRDRTRNWQQGWNKAQHEFHFELLMRGLRHFNHLGCAASTYEIRKVLLWNTQCSSSQFRFSLISSFRHRSAIFSLNSSLPSPLRFNSSHFKTLSIWWPDVYVNILFCLGVKSVKLFKSSYFHPWNHQVLDCSNFMNLTSSAWEISRTIVLKHITMSLIFLAFAVLVLVIPIFLSNCI